MDYYRYWGKAQAKAQAVKCHLLPYHNLDVAAVGWGLLAQFDQHALIDALGAYQGDHRPRTFSGRGR